MEFKNFNTEKKQMKKLMVAVMMAVVCAAEALAMPTKAELTKAQPLVTELMADDVAAFKAKSKKPEEIGDTSVAYAKEASTEAAKFLLLKGAISYYVRAEQYDKAADTVNELRSEIADVPPAVVEEIIRKSTARVTAKKAPRLFAQYETAKVQMAAAKEVAAAKTALAKNPGDAALTRRLAEAQAASGDWKTALGTFAQLNGPAGETAKAESEGKNLPDVADFWWAYESHLGAEDCDAFKAHAAEIYRKCLADGSIEGLKKNIVEKRLKQVEVVSTPERTSSDVPAAKGANTKIIELKIAGADPIRMIRCPAGSCVIGVDKTPTQYFKHKVTITRPFWMSEAPITIGQYCALMGSFEDRFNRRSGHGIKPEDGIRKLYKAMGGDACAVSGLYADEISTYCKQVASVCSDSIPHGCIVRLPTDAEWNYAFMCGGKLKEKNYVALSQNKPAPQFSKIGVDAYVIGKKFMAQEGVSFKDDKAWRVLGQLPRYRVKTCLPNDWGFYDMAGLCWELLADTVPPLDKNVVEWSDEARQILSRQYLRFVNTDTRDPIMIPDQGKGRRLMIGCNFCHMPTDTTANWDKLVQQNPMWRYWDQGFRLVIGPDLVGEWKAKHGGK